MDFLNVYGLVFLILLLIPNIIYALTLKTVPEVKFRNKTMELLEQLARFGCMFFMVVDIPGQGFCACGASQAYLIRSLILLAAYWIGWLLFWKDNSLEKALVLFILPSMLFLESGILRGSLPLTLLALLFAVCHISISCKNAS